MPSRPCRATHPESSSGDAVDPRELSTDLLVIGAGMGGLTAACQAASEGASVLVVEVAPRVGGSAALSHGFIWTAKTRAAFIEEDPLGDADRFEVMLGDLPAAFGWVKSLGVEIGRLQDALLSYGEGRLVDLPDFFTKSCGLVAARGGWIVPNTQVSGLIVEDGAVVGAHAFDTKTGEPAVLRAQSVVLATGGFQGDTQLLNRYLGLRSEVDMVQRANRWSRGRGLQLGLEAGGATSIGMDSFYGHLMPYPLDSMKPDEYAVLTQYHSDHGLLVDKGGARFTDESLGDHISAQEVAKIGTALLIIDERIREEHVVNPSFSTGTDGVNKLAYAVDRGSHGVTSGTVAELAEAAASWGYDRESVIRTVTRFNEAVVRAAESLEVPRKRNRLPIDTPPFNALEVQASITYTYGGLSTDADGRVLAPTGGPIPGLFAVGVDAGGLNVRGYTGGLVRGFVFGRRAARAALGLPPTP